MNRLTGLIIALAAVVLASLFTTHAGAAGGQMPVIYCADLFHPHDDPDDHFDIACLYALREIDIKAIILDQGAKQEKKPGKIPVEQLNHLTGRNVPWAIGLSQRLENPADKRLGEPEKYQEGVKLILDVLANAQSPVTIITVGSMRDVAASFNRQPDLFRKKVGRIFAYIGDAQDAFREYNVALDPQAHSCMMNAGLPFYWVPCFDGGPRKNEGHASFWQAKHSELLRDASAPVMNYFIYALLRKSEDHIGLLHQSARDDERRTVLAGTRNLWCSATFGYVANRKFVRRGAEVLAAPPDEVQEDDRICELFRFTPVRSYVNDKGEVAYFPFVLEEVPRSNPIMMFQVLDKESYASAMTSVTRHLIGELSTSIIHH